MKNSTLKKKHVLQDLDCVSTGHPSVPTFSASLLVGSSGYNVDGKLVVVSSGSVVPLHVEVAVNGLIALVKLEVSVLNVVALAFGRLVGSVAPLLWLSRFLETLNFLILLWAETARSPTPRFEKECVLLAELNQSFSPEVLKGDCTKKVDLVSSGEELVKAVSSVLALDWIDTAELRVLLVIGRLHMFHGIFCFFQ